MDSSLANNLDELQKVFNTRMQEYEDKLQKVSEGTKSGHPDLSSLSREYSDFKTFVWQAMSLMRSQINLLSLGQDRHETAMRRKVLLLHGVPEKLNENVQGAVLKVITNQMKLTDISQEHIVVCHRLGYSQSKTRPILVRFTNMDHRHLVWDNKTSLKGSGITISEFLTKTRHRAFLAARLHFGVKNCWSVEGKIVVMLPDKTRRKMESLSDVQALIRAHPLADGDKSPATASNVAASTTPKASAKAPAGTTAGKAPTRAATGKANRRA